MRSRPRLALALALLSAAPLSASAQSFVTPEQARADVALLRRAFELLHPGLYRYATPDSVAARFVALEGRLTRAATLGDAALALGAFAQTVRCGHTHVNPYNQSDSVTARLVEGARRLPFAFRWLDRRMVVTAALAPGLPIPVGTEVLAIDGTPTGDVLDALLPYTRTDGHNEPKRVAVLEVDGLSRYALFDVVYPLVFPLGDSARLRVRLPGRRAASTVRVATRSHADREAWRSARAAEVRTASGVASPLGWRLDALPDGSARLTMPTWATYSARWDWARWLDSTFDDLARRRVPRLVIDLRANEGGTEVGRALLSRLTPRPLRLAAFERFVRYRRIPDDLRPVLDTWDRSFDDRTADIVETRGAMYRLGDADTGPGGQTLAPRGTRYAGRVAVLVGPTNSSATFQFASDLQRERLGLLVGQPTGGNRRGINGGSYYFVRLPNTGLEIDLPLVAYVPPGGAESVPDAGLVPDVRVRWSAADVAAGRDPDLSAALAALRRPVPRGSR